MANGKTSKALPALAHAVVYSLPFLLLTPTLIAWLTIFGTHYLIDRYRLARYVCWAKNFLAPMTRYYEHRGQIWMRRYDSLDRAAMRPIHDTMSVAPPEATTRFARTNPPFAECAKTGYPADRPDWLAIWLLIFADNTIHIIINGLAMAYL
jgi:hypothetical protein